MFNLITGALALLIATSSLAQTILPPEVVTMPRWPRYSERILGKPIAEELKTVSGVVRDRNGFYVLQTNAGTYMISGPNIGLARRQRMDEFEAFQTPVEVRGVLITWSKNEQGWDLSQPLTIRPAPQNQSITDYAFQDQSYRTKPAVESHASPKAEAHARIKSASTHQPHRPIVSRRARHH